MAFRPSRKSECIAEHLQEIVICLQDNTLVIRNACIVCSSMLKTGFV